MTEAFTEQGEFSPSADPCDPEYLRHPACSAARYVESGLWAERRIDDLLLQGGGCPQTADRAAISADGRTISHAELGSDVESAVRTLARCGIERGTRVVVHLPNGADVIIVTIALLRIGAVPVFALPAHRASEIAHMARTARATFHLMGTLPGMDDDARARLIADVSAGAQGTRLLNWPVGAPPASDPPLLDHATDSGNAAELAFFQLSGGTTGPSKLIPRAHREYAYSFLRSAEVCGFDATTVLLPAIPLTHNFPMSSPGWMAVLASGGHVVVPAATDARTVGQAIREHGVTHVQAVPPLVHTWLESSDFPRQVLTRILVGGAPLAESVARRVHREMAPLQQVYGMTEGLVCYTPLDASEDLIATSQGRPMSPADEVRVIAANGREAAPGESGELQVRGPYTIVAYYRAGQSAAASFTDDGFYRTGDLVTRSADGDIRVVGRSKEQINRGGEKIAPAEVESFLLRHPGVSDVCVRGIADDVLGERVEAYLVPSAGWCDRIDTRVLRRHLRDASLADFKIPDRFHIVQTLPQTAVGKIDRRATGASQSTLTASAAAANADEVVDVLGVGFGPANMAVAAALAELPADSAPSFFFLDAASGPDWHTGMLLPDASMQVAFAKDLVTFRNPRSELSFLNFLVTQGRIHDFFNRGASAPLRIEFDAYLRWAAGRLRDRVRYAHRVTAIEPLIENGEICGYRVHADTPEGTRTFRARDVVLACGLQAHLPETFPAHDRLLHSSRYLHTIEDVPVDASMPEGHDVVVVGGGQSAAEIALDLRSRFPCARVHLIHSRFGLIPSDATPFANRIFDHDAVDRLYHAPSEVRERMENLHRNTNYSVVHEDTIRAVYDAAYSDSWTGRRRLVLHDASRVREIVPLDEDRCASSIPPRLRVRIEHELDGTHTSVDADVVIAATGYRPYDPAALLADAASLLVRDDVGRLMATRDYRAQWSVPAPAHFFALGVTGHQHGLATTLLSDIAERAGEVVDSLLAEREVDLNDQRQPEIGMTVA